MSDEWRVTSWTAPLVTHHSLLVTGQAYVIHLARDADNAAGDPSVRGAVPALAAAAAAYFRELRQHGVGAGRCWARAGCAPPHSAGAVSGWPGHPDRRA